MLKYDTYLVRISFIRIYRIPLEQWFHKNHTMKKLSQGIIVGMISKFEIFVDHTLINIFMMQI